MSGRRWLATTPEITTGTSALSVFKLTAPANHRVYVRKIDVSFKGIVVTDAPILVRLYKATTAGTFTSLTPVDDGVADAEAIQTTAAHTASAEPTKTDLLDSREIHPQSSGRFRDIWIPGGGRIVVEVTAGASTSVVVSAAGEE